MTDDPTTATHELDGISPEGPFGPANVGYCSDELAAAELRIENLKAALVNARKIGAAIGIIMASQKVTYDEAFALLARASQRGQEKLIKVAERVLFTGTTTP